MLNQVGNLQNPVLLWRNSNKLYIFDESTANLDAVTADKVLTNIEEYAKAIKAGVVYISHDKNVVDRCDTVIHVDNKVNTYEEQLAA